MSPFLEDELSKKHVCGQISSAFGGSTDAGRLPEPEEFPAHNGPHKMRLQTWLHQTQLSLLSYIVNDDKDRILLSITSGSMRRVLQMQVGAAQQQKEISRMRSTT